MRNVRARLPKSLVETASSGLSLSWVAAEDYLCALQALRAELGDAQLRAHFAKVYLALSHGRLLGPLTDGFLRLHGATPASLLRGTPRGWSLVAEGLGSLRVQQCDAGPWQVDYEYDSALDPEAQLLPTTFAGTFDGFYARCGIVGQCVMTNPRPGIAVFEL